MKTKNKQINMTTFSGVHWYSTTKKNAGTLSRLFTFQAIQINWKLQNKKIIENLNEKYIKRGTRTPTHQFISNTSSTWHILYIQNSLCVSSLFFSSDFSYGCVWDIPTCLRYIYDDGTLLKNYVRCNNKGLNGVFTIIHSIV